MSMMSLVHGTLLVETDFIEKFRHEAAAILTCATAPTTTIMVALVHHSPDGKGRHTTDAWVFLSEDKNHDFDFHIYAMDIIIKYYTEGAGRAATAGVSVPTIIMWTDGCGKQYKGKRNFYAVGRSLHRLGAILTHNFAVTSHFKGAHDGIGGLLKTLMRDAERKERLRIHNTEAAHEFLSAYAESKAEQAGGYLGKWSPYKIADFKMMLLGAKEIPRPPINLTGISGSSKLYQFMGLEEQEGVPGVCVGVQAGEREIEAGAVDGERQLVPNSEFRAADVWHTYPPANKVKETYTCRVRQASCYCSKCRVGAYAECRVASTYPDLVGMVHNRSGTRKADLRSFETQSEDPSLLLQDNSSIASFVTAAGVQCFVV